jgi:hypothetical protein
LLGVLGNHLVNVLDRFLDGPRDRRADDRSHDLQAHPPEQHAIQATPRAGPMGAQRSGALPPA